MKPLICFLHLHEGIFLCGILEMMMMMMNFPSEYFTLKKTAVLDALMDE